MKTNIFGFACIGLLFILCALYKCEHDKNKDLKYQYKIQTANIEALTDSLRVTKNKNDELEFNRKSFITNRIEELETLNAGLANEVKAEKGKVITLAKINAKLKSEDPVTVTVLDGDSVLQATIAYLEDLRKSLGDSELVLGLNLDTLYSTGNYRKLNGTVKISSGRPSATISEEIGISAVTGLKKNEDGDYEIFFRTTYPGLTVTNLEGTYIPKNQISPSKHAPRISLGLQFGYSPLFYNLDSKKLGLANQLTLGVGLNYRIIK